MGVIGREIKETPGFSIMNKKYITPGALVLLGALLLLCGGSGRLNAQTTTAFAYQGQLNISNAPATGSFDFQFSVYDATNAGQVVAGPLTNLATGVTDGVFAVQLDFGASAFTGPPRWLQVGVRSNGSTAAFTVLTPFQPVLAAPYAVTANSASNLLGSVSAGQLPSSVVLNGDTGITLGGTFSGSGIGLTSLNAASLSGSVPSGSLTSVPASSLTGTISSGQLPPGTVMNGNSGVTLTGNFSGNGSGLTGVNAATFSGTISSLGQLPNTVVFNGENNVSLNNGTFSGFFNGNGAGLNSLNAGNLTGTLPAGIIGAVPAGSLTGTVPPGALSGSYPNAVTLSNPGNTISGNGGGLTNLTAANLTGVVPLANLPGNVFTIFTNVSTLSIVTNLTVVGTTTLATLVVTNAAQFTNAALVVTNTDGQNVVINEGNISLTGIIAGNASGLTNANGHALADSSITNAVNLSLINDSNNVFLSASNFVYVASNTVEAALVSAGTLGSNFTLGASNNVMLIGSNSVYVASNAVYGAANTFTLGASNNVMLWASNSVYVASNTVESALLSTGQADTNFAKAIGTTISNYAQAGNLILSNYVAAGGTLPKGSLVSNAFLAGATTNLGGLWVTNGSLTVSNGAVLLANASGNGVSLNNGNTGNIGFSGVASGNGAGLTNVNAAMLETLTTNDFWLSGGNSGLTLAGANTLGTIDNQSLILKVDSQQGLTLMPDNTGNGLPSLVGDGTANSVDPSAYGTVVGGGVGNGVGPGSYLSMVGGGNGNTIGSAAFASAIGGGTINSIQNNAYESFIGGGLQNSIWVYASNSFIGGGNLNQIQSSASPSTGFSSISGGYQNIIGSGSGYASVGGGYLNNIYGNSGYSVIGGGQGNGISSAESVVGGGNGNAINGSSTLSVISGGAGNSISSDHATISGGQANSIASGSDHSVIAGGEGNSVTGSGGVVAGGVTNTATTKAFAAGTVAQAVHQGAFVWADSSGAGVASTNVDTVTFLAHGGYRLYSGAAAGVFLASGTTAWASISDRDAKKNISPVDPLAVLEKLAQVPVDSWNYKWEKDDSVPHIGPMAQDFKRAFYPGRDDKSITTLEFDGVELAAIQGLKTKVDEQEATVRKHISQQDVALKQQAEELKAKDAEIQSLKERLERLEKLVNGDKK
jgi:hypothetical protein